MHRSVPRKIIVRLLLLGAVLGCAQIAGLSTHVASDGGGADGGALAGGAGAAGPDGGSGASGGAGDGSAPSMCQAPDADVCASGLGNCNGTGCNVSLMTEPEHCGRCGHSCHGGDCRDGECVPSTVASGLHLATGRRMVAVSPLGIFYATGDYNNPDGTVWRVGFEKGATPVPLAQGEGAVVDILVDDQFVYLMVESLDHCQGEWCIRRIPIEQPDKDHPIPITTFPDIGRYSSHMVMDNEAIYFANNNANASISRIRTHGQSVPTVEELVPNQGTASTQLALDRGFLYWGSSGETKGVVKRMRVDKSDELTLATGVDVVRGVAVDEAYVYWTTGLSGTVQKAPLDGSRVVTTLATDKPFTEFIAVDDVYIYWSGHWGGFKKLAKCGGEPKQAGLNDVVFGIVPFRGDIFWNDSVETISRVAR